MKNCKILIFILSVILLLVVIKFIKGCRPKEGFNQEYLSNLENLKYNMGQKYWSQFFSPSHIQKVYDNNSPEELKEYLKNSLKNKPDMDNEDEKDEMVNDILKVFNNRYLNPTNSNNPYKWETRDWDTQTDDKLKFDNSDLSESNTIKSQIEIMKKYINYLIDSNKNHSWKGDVNSKKIDQIIKYINVKEETSSNNGSLEQLEKLITAQAAKNIEQDKALSTHITSQVKKDSEQDTAIVEIPTLIDNTIPKKLSEFESQFQTYQAAQEKIDKKQDDAHKALKSGFSTYSVAHTKNHSDLNKDISTYRTDHAMMHATQQATDNNQDTIIKKNYDDLEKWVKIFETARAKLDFKVKCQDKNGNDNWNVENCPDWLKGKSP